LEGPGGHGADARGNRRRASNGSAALKDSRGQNPSTGRRQALEQQVSLLSRAAPSLEATPQPIAPSPRRLTHRCFQGIAVAHGTIAGKG